MPDSQDRRNELNARLKEKLLQHCRGTCNLLTSIEDFHLVRRDVQKKPENCFEKPLAGLVIQGTKHSLIGGKDYVYTENQSIVAGVDMPIASYITAPTPEHPFLFLYLYLNRETLTDLVAEMGEISGGEEEETDSGLTIADTDEDIMEMFLRLMELLDKPEQISVRGPMMLRELHYLLLLSPHGKNLRHLSTPGTQSSQIVQAVAWIRENFREPMRVETLARQVHMSTANLYRRFKQMTGLSPLQYQKQMRLYEARRLMLLENERVSSAAFAVGYESVAQFNREYKRAFGDSPLRDISNRRAMDA